MANQWTEFHRERDRRRAPTFYAYVDPAAPRNADGTYNVIRLDTAERIRASRSNEGVHYAAGTAVEISNAGGAGLNRNVGFVILGLGSLALKNLSDTQLDQDATTKTGLAVYSLSPSPLVIRQGESATLTITGTGFTAAPTYSSAFITNTAETVTPTLITVTVTAAPNAVPGQYTVAIGGWTFPAAVRVTQGLFVWAFEETTPHVFRFSAVGELLATATKTNWVQMATDADDGYVYGIGSDNRLTRIDKATGDVTTTSGIDGFGGNSQVAYAAGHLYYANNSNVFLKYTTAGVLVSSISFAGLDSPFCKSACYDGTYLWVGGDGGVRRVDPATMEYVNYAIPAIPRIDAICFDGADLYGVGTTAGKVYRISTAGALLGTTTGLSYPIYVTPLGDHVYVGDASAYNVIGKLWKIGKSDMVTVASVATRYRSAFLAAGNGLVYVGYGGTDGQKGGVIALNPGDLSIAWAAETDVIDHRIMAIILAS